MKCDMCGEKEASYVKAYDDGPYYLCKEDYFKSSYSDGFMLIANKKVVDFVKKDSLRRIMDSLNKKKPKGSRHEPNRT